MTAIGCLIETVCSPDIALLFALVAAIADLVDEMHLIFYFGVGERRHNLPSHLTWLLPMVSISVLLQGLLVILL